MNNVLYVFLGGGLGSVARYGLTVWFRKSVVSVFPYATLAANATSSVILGLTLGWLASRQEATHSAMVLLITAGFCGGFSTFSTFSAETFTLLRSGMTGLAIVNMAVNMAICLLGIWAGLSLTRN